MRKIERITSPPPTDHAFFLEASGYHLHYWHLACTPWCCLPAPTLQVHRLLSFTVAFITLCSSCLPDRFCIHIRRQRVYPVVFIHFCRVTLLLWPGKHTGHRFLLSISRPPPLLCAAICRRHHLSPPLAALHRPCSPGASHLSFPCSLRNDLHLRHQSSTSRLDGWCLQPPMGYLA